MLASLKEILSLVDDHDYPTGLFNTPNITQVKMVIL